MKKVEGNIGGSHYYSQAEKRSYCDFINQELANINELGNLPLDPESEDLFSEISNGVVLCKLINKTFEDTIDESKLAKKPKNDFEKNINHDMCIEGAKKIGCSVVNIGGKDLLSGTPHLVMGILWQIIKRSLMYQIECNLDIERLMSEDELGNVPPEQILLRWFNYHLKRFDDNFRIVGNFAADLSDAECYAVLLHQISPDKITEEDLELAFREKDFLKRAEIILEYADRLGCKKFVTPQDIVDGNPNLNLAFTATLFKEYPSLGPTAEEIAKKQAEELETTLEETLFQLEEESKAKERIEGELARTKLDFDELFDSLGALNNQLDDALLEKESLENEKLSLEELMKEMETKNEELELNLTSVTQEKDDLFAQLEAELDIKSGLEEELGNLQLELENTKQESEMKISELSLELENEINLKEEFQNKLENTLSELEDTKQKAKEKEEELTLKLETETQLKEELTQELSETKKDLETAKLHAQEAEKTKDELFKLLTDTISELETTKDAAKKTQEELNNQLNAALLQNEELQSKLDMTIEEYERAKADWLEERERLLARIAELEQELEDLKSEMRLKLELADKEKEEALALAEAEKERALTEAENEKDLALGKVRLLLTGNQKQGILWKQENSMIGGLVWKKRFFVLNDNLLTEYQSEKKVTSQKPKSIIYCEQIRLYELEPEVIKKENAFEIVTEKQKVTVYAESMEEAKEWMDEIRVAKKKKLGVKVVSTQTGRK
eukprot:TRINITY_DN257_c1_g1_i1.p1 TRINITY_DN257_c1_g1~~TRINITY_DN257_c1_g1_i1.p1  ORF type:complete len:745 (-),score=330.47 TRINITY_DN257_c1_g1_i1:49-2253(-)